MTGWQGGLRQGLPYSSRVCNTTQSLLPLRACAAKGNMSDSEHQRTNSFIGTMEYMVGGWGGCGGICCAVLRRG